MRQIGAQPKRLRSTNQWGHGSQRTLVLVVSLVLFWSFPAHMTGQANGSYPDTDPNAYYSPAVDALAGLGVFEGTGCDSGFCPDDPIDRATMAVWLVRVLDGHDPQAVVRTRFSDVSGQHPWAPHIERLAELEVTKGCEDGTAFCPDAAVSRAEMATFLSRARNLPDGPAPDFTDVPTGAWYAQHVTRLAAAGITSGCGDGTRFCPGQDTTRAQMATFLARALGLVGDTVVSDWAALVALYNATDGPNWYIDVNWLSHRPLEEWYGVTVDSRTGRVTHLDLTNNNLKWEIRSGLSGLDALESLVLVRNEITDLSALADLESLRVLILDNNPFSDVSALSGLEQLETLYLSWSGVRDISPLLALPNLRQLSIWQVPLGGPTNETHIRVLRSKGVHVTNQAPYDTTVAFTVADGPQVWDDNLFILPVRFADLRNLFSHAKSFYNYFEDEFDFLMVIAPGYSQPPHDPHAFYFRIANDVQGIGIDTFSRSGEFGSAGKLQGMLAFSFIWAMQSTTISHELMHRWGAYVLPGKIGDGAHWFGACSINGILGCWFDTPFDEITSLGNGRYSALPTLKTGYAPLELYLAGFIPAEEVPEWWVAADAQWVEVGRTFTASEIVRYSVDDVIAEHGRRIPEASRAQREFRAAAILLVDEDNPATVGTLNFLSSEIARYSHAGFDEDEGYSNFYEATGGRAKIIMDGLSPLLKE